MKQLIAKAERKMKWALRDAATGYFLMAKLHPPGGFIKL